MTVMMFLLLVAVSVLLKDVAGTNYTGSDIIVNDDIGQADFVNCNDGIGIDCNVICNGTNSCQNSIINCPNDASCNITCIGETSCFNTQFNCPQNLSSLSSLECNINCGSDASTCQDSHFNAEYTSVFNLLCSGERGCDNTIINNLNGNLLTITLDVPNELENTALLRDWRTFENSQIFCPINGNCYINIDDTDGGFNQAIVWANYSNFIEINCNNYDDFSYETFNFSNWNGEHGSCQNIYVYAKYATKLILKGGPGAFISSSIVCPDHINQNGHSCELYGVRPINEWTVTYNIDYTENSGTFIQFPTFGNFIVYAKEGWNDIGLYCDDKISDYYNGVIDIDWVFYDVITDASTDFLVPNHNNNLYYDTFAFGCIDKFALGCQNDTLIGDHGETTVVIDECLLQYVKRDSFREYPDGNYSNNQTGRPTENYAELDFICSWFSGNGVLEAQDFVFNYYCFDQESLSPSLSPSYLPSINPSIMPSYLPSTNPTTIPTLQPSNIPSNQPSIQPSIKPSGVPTVIPTNNPIIETTMGNNNMETTMTTSNDENGNVNDSNDGGEQNSNNKNNCGFCGCDGLICIIIGIVLGMGLSVGVCCFCWQFLKYRDSKNDQDMSSRDLRLQTLSNDNQNNETL